MRMYEINTTHELAHLLEDIAKNLLSGPAIGIAETANVRLPQGTNRQTERNRTKALLSGDLERLADEVSGATRADAESKLNSLTIEVMRGLGSLLGIRTPSKARKDEYVELLLMNIFDAPAGQKVIRNFHDR